jgi:formylmethanofuran dehydrogenase subunit E
VTRMAKVKSLTFKERVFGGKVRCVHCREPFEKDKGWPSGHGLICPHCKGTWNEISGLCK